MLWQLCVIIHSGQTRPKDLSGTGHSQVELANGLPHPLEELALMSCGSREENAAVCRLRLTLGCPAAATSKTARLLTSVWVVVSSPQGSLRAKASSFRFRSTPQVWCRGGKVLCDMFCRTPAWESSFLTFPRNSELRFHS